MPRLCSALSFFLSVKKGESIWTSCVQCLFILSGGKEFSSPAAVSKNQTLMGPCPELR